jgi:hypothetical protein
MCACACARAHAGDAGMCRGCENIWTSIGLLSQPSCRGFDSERVGRMPADRAELGTRDAVLRGVCERHFEILGASAGSGNVLQFKHHNGIRLNTRHCNPCRRVLKGRRALVHSKAYSQFIWSVSSL